MWHKVVMVLHIPALFHAHEVLHRIQILPGARAHQELLHGHGVTQEHRDHLKQRMGNAGLRSPYLYHTLSVTE